jgi:regulator of nucleoside diphosphate kinase
VTALGVDARLVVAHSDWVRIVSLGATKIGGALPGITRHLRDKLAAAEIVDDERLPLDVASIGARVRYSGAGWRSPDEVELVFPWDAAPELGRVSVFSPLGAALLGVRVGGIATWESPRGRTFAWTVDGVNAPRRRAMPSRLSA